MAHMHATELGRELPPPIELPPDAIAEISVTMLRAQTFTAGNGVALLVCEGAHLVCRVTNGTGAPEFGARIPVEGTFVGLCLDSKRPQKCDDTETDPRVANAAYSRVKPRSILAVPVRLGNDVIAVLAVYSTSASAFTNTHIAILRTMADSLARHVQALPVLEPPSPASFEGVPVDVVVEPAAPAAPPESIAAPASPATISEPPREIPPPPLPEPVRVVAEPVAPPSSATPAAVPLQLTPTPVKKDEEPLVLASDPGPMPLPQIAAPHVFTAPRAWNLPRPLPRLRRRRATRIRIAVVTALVLASAIFAAGWKLTRIPGPPHIVSAALRVPAVVDQRITVAEPATPSPAASAPAPVSQVTGSVTGSATAPLRETKPPTPAATLTQVSERPAVIERAVPGPVKLADIPAPEPAAPQASEVEAPNIAMNVAPALPVIPAPVPTPVLRHSDLVPAKALHRVAPQYPAAAQRQGIAGRVVLSAVVRKDGSIGEVKMISGSPFLRDSAVQAVKQWRYSPAMLDGRPVESSAEIVLNFTVPR